MQLTKEDHKYRKEFGEICPIEEDPQNYYAQYFLAITRENYELLLREDGQDKPSKIVDALKAYDFKSLANAEEKKKVNVTLKAMEFTQSLFKPQDLNAENVDAVMRLCAIGFYIWFRVAVENPTDLDIMMFFQAKDEDVDTNMTYSLDANADWGKKQGYSYMDIETYFALLTTALPGSCSFDELYELCHALEYVCKFNVDNSRNPYFSQYTVSMEFFREHRKWCFYLFFFARKAWSITSKDEKKKLIHGLNITDDLPPFAQKKYKELRKEMKDPFFEEYSTHDELYERFFVSCIAFEAIRENMMADQNSKP